MDTTVVIPNYNGSRFLAPCLESLKTQTVQPAQIIVVDNGSEDDSLAVLERDYPEVKVIANEDNLGFSAAVNLGIEASTTPYVLLLNNDTEADPQMIFYLEQAMHRDARAFSVASKMIQLHHPDLIDSAGDLYTVAGWAVPRGSGHCASRYTHSCAVFSACAGAALYRREVFDKIGTFDERHFAYLEDVDIGYRARLFGYRNIYEPKALVRHVGSGTSGSKYNAFKVSLSARNNLWVIYKNMPLLQRIINAPIIALGCLIKLAFFAPKGLAGKYLRGLADGLTGRSACERIPFTPARLPVCLIIQCELILNLFRYVAGRIRRVAQRL